MKKSIFYIIVIYFILNCLFTFPLLRQSFDHICFSSGDPLAIVNVFFWYSENIFSNFGNPFNGHVFYPNSLDYLSDILLGDQIIFAPFYALTGNPVFATNMVVFCSFFLSALTMFALSYYWTKDYRISFIAGLIFGFSPIKLGIGQVQFMPIFWIPLFFLFFDKFLRHLRVKDFLLAALFYSIQTLSSWYVGYMLSLSILCYAVVFFIRNRHSLQFKRIALRSIPGIALILIMVSPFALYYLRFTSAHSLKKPLGETVQYSANPSDYFKANRKNVIFGKLRWANPVVDELPMEKAVFETALKVMGDNVNALGASKLPGETVEERLTFERFSSIINRESNEKSLFMGFIPVILSLLGVYWWVRKRPHSEDGKSESFMKEYTIMFSLIALLFIILSLGPFLLILGHFTYIPLPYLLFYYILPAFDIMRVPSRFGVMVMFALSALSVAGLVRLKEMITDRSFTRIAVPCIAIVFLLEALSIPVTMEKVPVGDEIPEVYVWLRDREIEGGVAEVPSVKGNLTKYDEKYGDRRGDFINREVMYWYFTTCHQKPIINGYATFYPDSYFEITGSLNDIANPESVRILRNYDINTFIVHRDFFDDEDMVIWSDANIAAAGLKIVAGFGSDLVLEWKE
ncbi:hypothetical protein ACFL6I_07480 [candidate division KSB1 bacterium]